MYKHILIPTDGSEVAEKAVEAGTNYAQEAGAKVLFFTAMPAYQPPSEAQMYARQPFKSVMQYEEDAAKAASEILDRVAQKAKAANVAFHTDYALSDHPYEAIIAAARQHGCDAIFMSSHGRSGLSGWLHGSQTRDVLTHSDIPTLVYR
jgi:nucleotide-binding universal stress UspA family protein